MKIRIYQMNLDRDINRIAFIGTKQLEKFFGITEINSSLYDRIYEGDVNCKTLEDVFTMFNLHHPENFKGWSMSTSDVIEIIDGEPESGFYFCDSFGFTKVDFDSTKCGIR